MSESQAQSEAARRAAARKAKILARGNAGLAKLAQTARGEEAETLYSENASKPTSASSSRPATPAAQSTSAPSWAPPPTSTSASGRADSSNTRSAPRAGAGVPGMTPEQQAMSAQLEAMMSMFGGAPPGGTGGEGMPDMSRLLAQMMGGDPSGGQNLLGDVDDPAGLGGAPTANPFAMGGLGGDAPFPNLGGLGGLGGLAGLGGLGGLGGQPKVKSKTEKYFPLIHFLAIITLALLAVVWWEPAIRSRTVLSSLGGSLSWSTRWAGYAGRRGWVAKGARVVGGVEAVPIFWAFTTLELILQTTRFMILKSPPPPHSLISTFLPLLPPKIAGPLVTGSRYLTLISQTWKDGCLLVFTIGMGVILAEWLGVKL